MVPSRKARQHCSRPHGRNLISRMASLWTAAIFVFAVALTAVYFAYVPAANQKVVAGGAEFGDARTQAAEFIAKYNSVSLTPAQRKIREEALSSIPAPCCKEFSIETCCCPCNLAKSVWGLASKLIAERDYDAAQVNSAVKEWIQFTNANGYTGDACHRGGCGRPFDKNGCGGMNENSIS